MKKYLVLPSILLIIIQSTNSQVREFSWLIGTWKEKNSSTYESWKIVGQNLEAVSYQLTATGEKRVTEEIKLIKKDGKIFYVPDVEGDQGPIYFEITSYEANSFVAENPSHDFPKKIIYRKIDDTHLQASIQDDKKVITFNFEKTK